MPEAPSTRPITAAAACAYAAAVVMLGVEALAGGPEARAASAIAVAVCLPSFGLGVLLRRRRPTNPTGPALMALAAGPSLALAVEGWAASATSGDPLPLAATASVASAGAWVLNLTGFVLLCLTFPDAYPLDGRSRRVVWSFAGTSAVTAAVVAMQTHGGFGSLPAWSSPAASLVTGAALVLVLGSCVVVLGSHYQRGDEVWREQMHWLFLGSLSVPVLLVNGWLLQYVGVPVWLAYLGFMVALLVVLPATITVAVLRHDLLDIDRLLGDSVAGVVTAVAAAAVFAAIVLVVGQAGSLLGGTTAGVTAAAFVTALVLLPLHHRVRGAVGRVIDPDRTFARARVAAFVQGVQAGRREPEEVEAVLRECLGDAALQLHLTMPDGSGLVDLAGSPVEPGRRSHTIDLQSRGAAVGEVCLTHPTARRLRLTRELAVEARLAIEVSRLRLGLRDALADASASRARLVEAAAEERLRMERDLHDGIQPRILAVGMGLRSLQRRTPPDGEVHAGLDSAVDALEQTVGELRRLAHGLRPSGLDDGLEQAIRGLVVHSPIPVHLDLLPVNLSEAAATTAYYVVAEGLSNAFKHAGASSAAVLVRPTGDRASITVSDDGRGGARAGTGLTSLRDRVAALGGRIEVHSPPGEGTVLRAVI